MKFIPLTEEEIIISYSLSYSGTPDSRMIGVFRGLALEVNIFNKSRAGKIYTHSIEQYTRNGDFMTKSFRVSVFSANPIDIEEVKENIQNALMFSRCFKTKGSADAMNMTKQRTANMFGRAFARVSDLRALLIDRNEYGYNLLEICIRAAFLGSLFTSSALFQIWGRACISRQFVEYFMVHGFSRLSKGCVLCSICVSGSCKIIFKPAGKWMDVIMDVFKAGDHIKTVGQLISTSYRLSGELLDYGHCVAYRPGVDGTSRIDLTFARVLRWAYRLSRSLIGGALFADLIDFRSIFLRSIKAYTSIRIPLLSSSWAFSLLPLLITITMVLVHFP
ncbi:hypothetical protein FRX31_015043 [Thalictrum thalictroides]|uniref:Uncharacterized protein n=1 Tax=Thalictrum thalictroides TaxID=46969 RepID=A0A7J6WFJ6_THATH|nr:hypothetical protein FRX31_015043 [Thalictrum thalictroides]